LELVTERVELPKLELSIFILFFGCRKEVGGFVKKRLPKCWCSKQTGKQLGWVTAPEMSQQRRKLQGQNETQKKSSNKKCSRVSLSIDDRQMAVLQVSSIWGTVKTFLSISFACSLHVPAVCEIVVLIHPDMISLLLSPSKLPMGLLQLLP
jgi:hypothetical protein